MTPIDRIRTRARKAAAPPPETPPATDTPPAPPLAVPWPDPANDAAFAGPVGEYVRAVAPLAEADPAAVLLQALVAFGNVAGREAHMVVGTTAGGRKGTSGGVALSLFADADADGLEHRLANGPSSGEGLIWFVRDPIEKRVPVREKGQPTRYETEVTDEGVVDKRAMVVEPEFVNVLKQAGRQGNTLSAVIRLAWDSGHLRAMTKNSPARASNAHVSVVGHLTPAELERYLCDVEAANGFGNRFLWCVARRSRFMPDAPRIGPAVAAGPRAAVRAAVQAAQGGARCRGTRRPRSCGGRCTATWRRSGRGCAGRCSPGPPRT